MQIKGETSNTLQMLPLVEEEMKVVDGDKENKSNFKIQISEKSLFPLPLTTMFGILFNNYFTVIE